MRDNEKIQEGLLSRRGITNFRKRRMGTIAIMFDDFVGGALAAKDVAFITHNRG